MTNQQWVLCPLCNEKTRIKITKDTIIEKLPLYCPKCKHETTIDIVKFKVKIVEPDAKTQSQ